jgi:hypothetical protein
LTMARGGKITVTTYSYQAIVAAVLRELGISEGPDSVKIMPEPENEPRIEIVSINGGKPSVMMLTKDMTLHDVLRIGL